MIIVQLYGQTFSHLDAKKGERWNFRQLFLCYSDILPFAPCPFAGCSTIYIFERDSSGSNKA
jgi:hypothetical protein